MRDIEEDEELRANLNLFKAPKAEDNAMMEESDIEDEEEDFPEINVDALLDEMDNLNIVSICLTESGPVHSNLGADSFAAQDEDGDEVIEAADDEE